MNDVTEINVETGEVIVRGYTQEDLQRRQLIEQEIAQKFPELQQ